MQYVFCHSRRLTHRHLPAIRHPTFNHFVIMLHLNLLAVLTGVNYAQFCKCLVFISYYWWHWGRTVSDMNMMDWSQVTRSPFFKEFFSCRTLFQPPQSRFSCLPVLGWEQVSKLWNNIFDRSRVRGKNGFQIKRDSKCRFLWQLWRGHWSWNKVSFATFATWLRKHWPLVIQPSTSNLLTCFGSRNPAVGSYGRRN